MAIEAASYICTECLQMSIPISRRVLKGLKECTWKLDDLECFAQYLEEWVLKNLNDDRWGAKI